MKRFSVLLGGVLLLAFALLFGTVACNSSSSSSSDNGTDETPTGAAELSDENITLALQTVEDNVPGCQMVDAQLVAAPLAAMASAARTASQPIADIGDLFGEPIPGDCGGTVTINMSEAGQALMFSVAFDNFCTEDDVEGPVTVNGAVSGSFEESQTGASFTAGIDGLTVQSGGETVAISLDDASGNFDGMTESGSFSLSTLTIDFVDEGVQHSLTDLNASLTVSDDYDIFEINSGRYESSEQGYVDIYTTEPLVIDAFTEEWVSGKIAFAGSGGDVVTFYPDSLQSGIFRIEINGEPFSHCLDCTSAEIPDFDLLLF